MVRMFEYRHKDWGKAFLRISIALRKYSPEWITWVNDPNEADVLLVHVVGPGEIPYLQLDKPKIIWQQCYLTAQPENDYVQYWKQAKLVVSFNNLKRYTDEKFNFLHLPLGAEPEIFYLEPQTTRPLLVFTTGHVAETESLDKVYEAVRIVGGQMWHTGEDFKWDPRYYRYLGYLPDDKLRHFLNNVKYVACLRQVEGFELLGIEGLFCGARPIVLNLESYDWYRMYGYTISGDITASLVEILSKEPRPMSSGEHREIVNKFCWQSVLSDLFAAIWEVI